MCGNAHCRLPGWRGEAGGESLRSRRKPTHWIRRASIGILCAVGSALVLGACSSPPKAPTAKAEKTRPPAVPVVKAVDAHIASHPVDKSDPLWKTRVPRPPMLEYDPSLEYYWFLHTSEGGIKIKLKPEYAPGHVTSTIYLTRLGFYDGLTFHRIIPKFMAQGGDPLGNGSGGPGYRMAGEFSRKARHNKRGVVSAANSGPRTDGSQFFIMFGSDAEHLDGKHTVYGQVVEGMGTLKNIEVYGSESGVPERTVYIRRAEILEQPADE